MSKKFDFGKEKTSALRERILERIMERTGITNPRSAEVYFTFCHHADLRKRIVMYGDVIFDLRQEAISRASEPMQILEKAYYEAVGNKIGIPHFVDEKQKFVSPPQVEAEKTYREYLKIFIEKELVDFPVLLRSGDYYPVLRSYNPLNDGEFYEKDGENGRRAKL